MSTRTVPIPPMTCSMDALLQVGDSDVCKWLGQESRNVECGSLRVYDVATVSGDNRLSVQERLYPESTCFGCGLANDAGLHLKSYVTPDGVVATFEPGPMHTNGMGTLNGGIIATLLDCHSGAAVFWESADGGEVLANLWVTTEFEIRYRLPTAMGQPVELQARVIEKADDTMVVKATLAAEGKVRVQAQSRWASVRTPRSGGAPHR